MTSEQLAELVSSDPLLLGESFTSDTRRGCVLRGELCDMYPSTFVIIYVQRKLILFRLYSSFASPFSSKPHAARDIHRGF